jgi:CRP-like cAMP-binding protein
VVPYRANPAPKDRLNRLLAYVSDEDRSALDDRLERVRLPSRYRLAEYKRSVAHVYFLDAGLASVAVRGRRGDQVDVGLLGNEGCSSATTLLGIDRSPYEVVMQVGGLGRRIGRDEFCALCDDRAGVRAAFLRYLHTVGVQHDETALAAARGTLAHRIARLLLMAQDRLGSDLPLTHDFFASSLCGRRAGVTVVLQRFRVMGLVSYQRGNIAICNREGLIAEAEPFYGGARDEYEKLFAKNEHRPNPGVVALAAST